MTRDLTPARCLERHAGHIGTEPAPHSSRLARGRKRVRPRARRPSHGDLAAWPTRAGLLRLFWSRSSGTRGVGVEIALQTTLPIMHALFGRGHEDSRRPCRVDDMFAPFEVFRCFLISSNVGRTAADEEEDGAGASPPTLTLP